MEVILNVLVAVLLGIMIGTSAKANQDLKKRHIEDNNRLQDTCMNLTERLIKLETKTDIFLDHAGFSVPKIDRAIREHMEDLKENDRPTVGCIDYKSLYKETTT